MEQKTAIEIYFEANPNPNSLKFVTNLMLMPEGEHVDIPDAERASISPLAEKLFSFPYIERVFFMNNFITLTKKESVDWEEVKQELRQVIAEYLASEKTLFTNEAIQEFAHAEEQNEDDELVVKIKSILEEYVKPAVEMDGGAITFESFHDGVVSLNLQGSCSGCPSSIVTLKAGIENLLTRMVPEVKTVEAKGV